MPVTPAGAPLSDRELFAIPTMGKCMFSILKVLGCFGARNPPSVLLGFLYWRSVLRPNLSHSARYR